VEVRRRKPWRRDWRLGGGWRPERLGSDSIRASLLTVPCKHPNSSTRVYGFKKLLAWNIIFCFIVLIYGLRSALAPSKPVKLEIFHRIYIQRGINTNV
jgi:hypothetical protein